MRTLLVMADPRERRRWEALLRERHHVAVSARPGPEAWRQAAAGGLECLVVAHGPDEADARELVRLVRAAEPEPRPFVLVLLAVSDAPLLLPLLRDGADDTLIGPLDHATMRARLLAAERRLGRSPDAPTAHELAQRAAADMAADGAVVAPYSADEFAPGELLPMAAAPAGREQAARPDRLGAALVAWATANAAASAAYASLPADPGLARAELRRTLDALQLVRDALANLGGVPVEGLAAAEGPARTPLPASSRSGVAQPPARSIDEQSATARAEASPLASPAAADEPAPSDRPLVVLAEDDELVRRPLRRTLEHVGFDVLEAADGERALRLVMEHLPRVRLVVTDHRMPRMTGAELVRELRRRAPGVPVVLVSGHGAEDVAAEVGADAWLRKPFQLVDLARTARLLLEARAA